MKMKMHTLFVVLIGLCTGLVFLNMSGSGGCGASSAPSVDIPSSSSLTITGTVTTASSGAAGLVIMGRGMLAQEVGEEPAAGETGHVYTLEGEDLGTFTTDASGNFSIDVALDDLKGGEDAGSTTWSEEVVLETDAGIKLYAEVEVTEGETTTVDMGTAGLDSTLATSEVEDGISGFTEWGVDYGSAKDSADLTCIYEAAHAMWGDASLNGEGIADDVGLIGDAIKGYLAAGGDPADLGYDTVSDLVDACLDGTIDDGAAWSDMLTTAATVNDSIDPATGAAAYGDSFAVVDSLHSMFTAEFGAGGDGTAALSTLTKHEVAEEGSVCDSIKSGSMDPSAFTGPLLASGDLDELTTTYGGDGFKIFTGLLGGCLADCAGGVDCCAGMMGDGAWKISGFMSGYGGDFSSVYGDGAYVDTSYLDGIWGAAFACSGGSSEEAKDCALAMWGTVYEGAGGWDSFQTADGAFNTSTFDAWGGYWATQNTLGFNPETAGDTFYTSTWDSNYTTFSEWDAATVGATNTCIDTLTAAGSYDFSSCYADTSYSYTPYTSYDGWSGGSTGEASPCGDFVCSGGETATSCPIDCNTTTTDTYQSYGYCGDTFCSGGETATSCCLDCGGCSSTYCGDHACNGTETASTCPIDCGSSTYCGDHACNGTETVTACPIDCGSVCNNDGVCDQMSGEYPGNCPADCSKTNGQGCTNNNQCASFYCSFSGAAGTCQTAPTGLPSGSSCITNGECLSFICNFATSPFTCN